MALTRPLRLVQLFRHVHLAPLVVVFDPYRARWWSLDEDFPLRRRDVHDRRGLGGDVHDRRWNVHRDGRGRARDELRHRVGDAFLALADTAARLAQLAARRMVKRAEAMSGRGLTFVLSRTSPPPSSASRSDSCSRGFAASTRSASGSRAHSVLSTRS
jgi:hypothetical protein